MNNEKINFFRSIKQNFFQAYQKTFFFSSNLSKILFFGPVKRNVKKQKNFEPIKKEFFSQSYQKNFFEKKTFFEKNFFSKNNFFFKKIELAKKSYSFRQIYISVECCRSVRKSYVLCIIFFHTLPMAMVK